MSDPSSRDLLAKLVSFPTVSRDSNLALIHFIRDHLASFGVESELFLNAEGSKASLYATIGPKDRGGVALSGHTDVVPVDGQAWTVDPFALSEQRVARVAITGSHALAVGRLVLGVMTAETAGPILVADVVRIDAPVRLALGENGRRKDLLHLGDRGR